MRRISLETLPMVRQMSCNFILLITSAQTTSGMILDAGIAVTTFFGGFFFKTFLPLLVFEPFICSEI
jgi:hypothetical protein